MSMICLGVLIVMCKQPVRTPYSTLPVNAKIATQRQKAAH
jgi:hypothetical protein